MAITSKEINLLQLDEELGNKGLIGNFNDFENKLILPADNADITEAELVAAIASHVAQSIEPTLEEKLATVGLSLPELKTALGL